MPSMHDPVILMAIKEMTTAYIILSYHRLPAVWLNPIKRSDLGLRIIIIFVIPVGKTLEKSAPIHCFLTEKKIAELTKEYKYPMQ